MLERTYMFYNQKKKVPSQGKWFGRISQGEGEMNIDFGMKQR